jgi:hypothetical protein
MDLGCGDSRHAAFENHAYRRWEDINKRRKSLLFEARMAFEEHD